MGFSINDKWRDLSYISFTLEGYVFRIFTFFSETIRQEIHVCMPELNFLIGLSL